MTEQEIKAGLESLTKPDIIKTFPSLELKPGEKKAFLIESILTGEPTEEEKEAFKELISKKEAEEEVKLVKEKAYIVVHQIKEDGVLYEKGDEYKGKFPARFLGDQIKLKG